MTLRGIDTWVGLGSWCKWSTATMQEVFAARGWRLTVVELDRNENN